jgi:integrase
MTVVRGFARHMSGIDPATEVPPLGLVSFRQRWRPPFIYSPGDVEALMAEVPWLIPSPFRATTFQTMIGLLAATGMRVGEAIALARSDVDLAEGVLVVRASKFNKSRELPLHPSAVDALGAYVAQRDSFVAAPKSPTFFVSGKGTPIIYADFGVKFRELVAATRVGAGSPVVPRIHDLRHSFAVHTLVRWHKAGEDVGALLPRLSTYMGHLTPGYTYWYLSAAPELLALAAARLEKAKGPRA